MLQSHSQICLLNFALNYLSLLGLDLAFQQEVFTFQGLDLFLEIQSSVLESGGFAVVIEFLQFWIDLIDLQLETDNSLVSLSSLLEQVLFESF